MQFLMMFRLYQHIVTESYHFRFRDVKFGDRVDHAMPSGRNRVMGDYLSFIHVTEHRVEDSFRTSVAARDSPLALSSGAT